MKRRLIGLAALAAVMGLSTNASGFGGKKTAPCGTTGIYGGCGSPCAPTGTTTYVDQKVLVSEWVTAKEDYTYWAYEPSVAKQKVTTKQMAWKDETFQYTANELVTSKEKVTVKQMAWKDETFQYTANELVTSKEKVKVGELKPVVKDVEFTSYTLVPSVTKQKQTVCEWICVPVTVTCAAPVPTCASASSGGLFGRLCKKKQDCGSPCATGCDAPCPAPVVTKTVMQRQMVTRVIDVDVTTYQRVEKKEKKPVTSYVTVWTDKDVDVTKCVAVPKTGTRKVCYWVDVTKDVDVTTYNKVEKKGTRDVRKCIQTEKVVKVPVYTPAPVSFSSPCATPCAPVGISGGCGSAHGGLLKGGLFAGKGCCK